jgi:putative chitobiose transport system substrate-binding protein
VDVPYDVGPQKLLAAVNAGTPPDVMNLYADQVPQFASMGALANLDQLLPPKTREAYLDAPWKSGVINGVSSAIPWYLATDVVMYNSVQFREAGMDSSDVPKTFTELVAFAKKYKDKTGKYGFFYPLSHEGYLLQLLSAEGVEILDSTGKEPKFNSPQGLAIIKEWVKLYRDGYLPREAASVGHRAALEQYQSKQIALIFTGPQFLNVIKQNSPQVYADTRIAPVILGATGKHHVAIMYLSVLEGSKHKKEAADFAAYVTNAENQLAFSKIVTLLPSVKAALNDAYFTTPDSTLESKARIIGARQLPSAVNLRLRLEEFSKLMTIFQEEIQKSCIEGTPVEETMADVVKQWREVLISSR